MPLKKGETVFHNGIELTVIDIRKGSKTKKRNYAGGIVFTGYKSKPCVYILSNGSEVKGDKLKRKQPAQVSDTTMPNKD